MFGGPEVEEEDTETTKENYDTACEPWLERTRLDFEKESIGFYVSGHPLNSYRNELGRYASNTIATLDAAVNTRGETTLGAVVIGMRERPLRSGNGRMAFVVLEDLSGQIETIFFSKAFEESEEALKSGDPLLVFGNARYEGDEENKTLKLRAAKAVTLSQIRREKTNRVKFIVDAARIEPDGIARLAEVLRAHPGECSTLLKVVIPSDGFAVIRGGAGISVDPSDELVEAAERILGRDAVLMSG
jgi:DNA polymerase-3 subunit alpha